MGAYHLIQLLLGGVVVALVWRRCRALLYRAQLDAKPFQAAFLPAFEGGEFERLGSLISPARPAWLAEVGEAALDARMEGLPIGPILDEILLDLRFRSLEGLRALRIMVTLGSTSGLLGALLELRWLLGDDHGLDGLVLGLPETIASDRALLSVMLGVGIAVFSGLSLSILSKEARRLLAEAIEFAEALEIAADSADEAGVDSVRGRASKPAAALVRRREPMLESEARVRSAELPGGEGVEPEVEP